MAMLTYNLSVKGYNKISKYKDLIIEIEKIWLLKTTTVSEIIGTLGKIKKMTDKHIDKIPGFPYLYEIQEVEFCRTTHLLRRLLSI